MYDERHWSGGSRSLDRNYSSCSSAQRSDILTSHRKPPTPTTEGSLPPAASPPCECGPLARAPILDVHRADDIEAVHPPTSLLELSTGTLSLLQTQVQLNTMALEVQRRASDNLSRAVNRLSNDFIRVDDLVADLRRGLISHPTPARAPSPSGVGDTVVGSSANDIDRLADDTSSLANKVSEVDPLGTRLVKRRMMNMDKVFPTPVCPPNSTAPRGSSSSIATPRGTSQTHRLSRHSTSDGSPPVSDNGKRQHSAEVDSAMGTRSSVLGSSKRQKPAHVESHIGSDLASASSPMRHGMVEANGRNLHAEAMYEQQRRAASMSAASAWRTNGVSNPQDGHADRRSSGGNRHMAERSDAGAGKTEWRPIRNADGVLLRKDGTPDMRSPLNRIRASQGEAPKLV